MQLEIKEPSSNMKLKVLNIIIGLFIMACCITSCLDSDVQEYELSSNSSITAFSITDSIITRYPAVVNGKDTTLSKSVVGKNYPFVINQNEGLIYNPDSLPMGTDVSKVVIDIAADTEWIYIVAEKDSVWNAEDSLSFVKPIQFKVLAQNGTFGRFGVLSFNGNKMITTSGGGALICRSKEDADNIMWHATQARDSYPYYQHSEIGFNYRMSNVCAGIGRGQMMVLDSHISHHKHVQDLYRKLLEDVKGVTLHDQPADSRYDSNFWLCAATLDPDVKVKGQENAYKEVVNTAVGGAAGVIKTVDSAVTDCQPNENVEALRVYMLSKKVECRPVWKPMHKQPVYADAVAYVNGVSEDIFKVGFCLPAGPCVTDDDVHYIVECIKEAIC